jgi:hypothetical protein
MPGNVNLIDNYERHPFPTTFPHSTTATADKPEIIYSVSAETEAGPIANNTKSSRPKAEDLIFGTKNLLLF